MWAGQLWQAGWVRLSLGVRGAGTGTGIGLGGREGVPGQGVLWPPWQDGWSNMSQSGLGYIPHQSHPGSMAVGSAGLGHATVALAGWLQCLDCVPIHAQHLQPWREFQQFPMCLADALRLVNGFPSSMV